MANLSWDTVWPQLVLCCVSEPDSDKLLVVRLRTKNLVWLCPSCESVILRCIRWHSREHSIVWPWDLASVTRFVKSLGQSASAVNGFYEAVRFSRYVMAIPFDPEVLGDRRLQGRARRLAGEAPETRQQVPLSVEQVARLERLVASRTLCHMDCYILGGLLFALFSRSRWSDLKNVDSIWLDFDDDDECSGFIEARTRAHKTSNTVRTKKKAMPLVAPFPGVTEAAWAKVWWEAGVALGVDWDCKPLGPVVRAPAADGSLAFRRCSSTEAGTMLCKALGLEDEERRTSHVLKGSTLAWVGKRGFSERDGLLLGHHATGSSSLACYSRELLSAPLRAYRAMLAEIRKGSFRPDTTRSGWLASSRDLVLPSLGEVSGTFGSAVEPTSGLPTFRKQAEGHESTAPSVASHRSPQEEIVQPASPSSFGVLFDAEAEGVNRPVAGPDRAPPEVITLSDDDGSQVGERSSSGSSSSSSDSGDEASESEEQTMRRVVPSQGYEIDEPCWQHARSRILHRVQGLESDHKTRCGRQAGLSYWYLPGAYLHWPKCTACWRS